MEKNSENTPVDFRVVTPGSHNRALFFIPVFTFFISWFPLSNTDMWWHLASAKEIITNGFLFKDPFSYTETSSYWLNIHWLFQLGFYGLYNLVGFKGIIFTKALLFSLSSFILVWVFNIRRLSAGVLITIPLLYFMVRYLMLARPIVLTILFMVLMIYIFHQKIYKAHSNHNSKPNFNFKILLILMLIQILWANIQGLFILGPIIAGSYVLAWSIDRKMYGIPFKSIFMQEKLFVLSPIILFLISASNPSTWKIYLYPFKLFGRIDNTNANVFSLNVSENYSLIQLFHHQEYGLAFSMVLFISLIIFTLIKFYKYSESKIISDDNEKIKFIAEIIIVGFLAVLAVMAKRNILLFYLIAAPVVANWLNIIWAHHNSLNKENLSSAPKLKSEVFGNIRPLNIILISTFILLFFIHLRDIMYYFPKNTALAPFRHPITMVNYLKENPIDPKIANTKIFNGVRDGGYINWALFPQIKSFVDGRLILRTPKFYASYLEVLDNPAKFLEYAKKYDINRVLLPTVAYNRYFKLVNWLVENSEKNEFSWTLEAWDGERILFVRNDLVDAIRGNYSHKKSIYSVAGISDPLNNYKWIKAIADSKIKKWENGQYTQKESVYYMTNLLKQNHKFKQVEFLEKEYIYTQ